MPHSHRWVTAAALLACVSATGCAKSSEFDAEPAENQGAAKVVEANGVQRVTLTDKAQQRLGIQTAPIARAGGGGGVRMTIPYAAVLYDASGHASTFTSPAPRTFVERPISIAYVRGGRAYLKSGPPAGTPVVTLGSAELLGTAHGVEEE